MQWCGCRDCHISCHVIISFLEIWTTMCLQRFLVILRIIQAYLTWINGCLGNHLAMVRQDKQDMLHRYQLCVEISGGYVENVGAIKVPGKKIILPIITQIKSWILAMVTLTFECNFSVSCLITRHSSIWIYNDFIYSSLPSQLPKLAKSGKWHCHLQWQLYLVMRDIYMMQKGY